MRILHQTIYPIKAVQVENEKKLVEQLSNNDLKAFDQLYNLYSQKLYRFSFSMLKNVEDSKEIVQEVFFRVWNKRQDINTSKSFKSFLFTISYNLIVDQLRLKLKENEYRNFLKKYFDSNSVSQSNLTDFETISKQVELAVEELPGKRKQIYTLSRKNGLSHKEIAGQLGITVKTVENQISLALKHIKLKLGKDILLALLFLNLFH